MISRKQFSFTYPNKILSTSLIFSIEAQLYLGQWAASAVKKLPPLTLEINSETHQQRNLTPLYPNPLNMANNLRHGHENCRKNIQFSTALWRRDEKSLLAVDGTLKALKKLLLLNENRIINEKLRFFGASIKQGKKHNEVHEISCLMLLI